MKANFVKTTKKSNSDEFHVHKSGRKLNKTKRGGGVKGAFRTAQEEDLYTLWMEV